MNIGRYTHRIKIEGDEFHSAEAKTKEEAKALIESEYSYVTEIEGVQLFRKPK